MPLARIDVRRPRPEHEVHALIDAVHDALREAFRIPEGPSDVLIVLHEPPLENWGIRGGRPASEVELGLALDV